MTKHADKSQADAHDQSADHGHRPDPRSSGISEDENAYQRQIAELTEALQRERADAMNIRRRHEADMAGMKAHVKANVVRDLLPVIDNLERALKHVPDDLKDHDYVKGVQAVVKQFEKTLSDVGVERIATIGQAFDPRFHEAVSMEDGDGTVEVVSEELQSGYKVGDDIIRHAMVRVRLEKR